MKDTSVGIICLTQENRVRPWILFEAGALAKGLSTARVCTLLIDLEPKDVEDPLAQFNHTSPTEESMFNLVRTLNTALGVNGLDPRVLEQVFETYWPQFDKKFKDIVKNIKDISSAKPRAKDDLLGEILENTRLLNNRIRRLERAQEEFPIKQNIKNLIEYKLARGNSRENIIEELRSRVPIQIINEILGKLESKNTITDE